MTAKQIFNSIVFIASLAAAGTAFAQSEPCKEAPATQVGTEQQGEAPCTAETPDLVEAILDPTTVSAADSVSTDGLLDTVMRYPDFRFGTDNYDDPILNGRSREDLEHSAAPVYTGMDLDPELLKRGIKKPLADTPARVRGQNMWIAFPYGDYMFWDYAAKSSHGWMDLVKALDPRAPITPDDATSRKPTEWKGRFEALGVIRTPGFAPALDGDGKVMPDEFGLFFDQPSEEAKKHFGQLDPTIYGQQSPVMGLMMFKNPKFDPDSPQYDAQAVALWESGYEDVEFTDPKTGETVVKKVNKKYYEDSDYFRNPNLERPYMVGMACGFCHVSPSPVNPPENPDYPKMENLTSTNGQPYLREKFFAYANLGPDSVLMQMWDNARPPGTNDTSLAIPMDHINNPNQMNGTWALGARLALAERDPQKQVTIRGETLEYAKHFYDIPEGATEAVIPSPGVLKDGADFAGIYAALARVPHNIGLAWQETMQKSNPLVGIIDQHPMSIEEVAKESPWTQLTWDGLKDEAAFLLQSPTYRLKDTAKGEELLRREGAHPVDDADKIELGKTVFADKCATCHSSKEPDDSARDMKKAWRELVHDPDFLNENYLSNDRPIPLTDVKTHPGRAMATNALAANEASGGDGNLWYWWTSDNYRKRRTIGKIEVENPITGEKSEWQPYGGGTGYYRPAPLNGIWSRGGFGYNKQIGGGSNDPEEDARIKKLLMSPDIQDRIELFNISWDQLMNPEKRRGEGSIYRTDRESYLDLPASAIPQAFRKMAASPNFPWDGKSIDPTTGMGINRMRLPNQPGLIDQWPFKIGLGNSQLEPGKTALVLDYESPTCADAPDNYGPCRCKPGTTAANPLMIRKIHDEVREVDGLFFGPAMWKSENGDVVEVLWFALDPEDGTRAPGRMTLDKLAGMTSDQLRELYKTAKTPSNEAQASEMLKTLAGEDGKPKGRMLAVRELEQGATDGPLAALLASLGIDEIPDFRFGPIPAGTPIDLIFNTDPTKLKGLVNDLLKPRAGGPSVLDRYQSIPDEAQRKKFFDAVIAPALLKASKGPYFKTDVGHYYGTVPGSNGWVGDRETNDRPYDPESNPDGVLTDAQKEALRAFILQM